MSQWTPERRSSQRYPAFMEGWIACGTTGEPIECTVWDLSEAGVRLVVPPPADVPLEFELRIPSEDAKANVRLIWTTGIHYGAKFMD
ncbi:PilZ domain-containing protein [Microvirga lotononidis]|uniref:PilZ domain-containing protein n=1 Tax=Microvirga lotononidis TaxID=864069 RepID=I4YY31_9HYPH|nr:PilZ domain-containing protein [Microvirga lotononidis]EIM28873.1 PilZ domain-containing protein [Microvirga lotononidis]WQO26795.1 PilZ domain-containing protein [Microvirga lotononidis]